MSWYLLCTIDHMTVYTSVVFVTSNIVCIRYVLMSVFFVAV